MFSRWRTNPGNQVYIKYKKYNHKSNFSAGYGLFIKLMKIFSTKFKEFTRRTGKLFFQEFSRGLEENFKIPEVFQEF